MATTYTRAGRLHFRCSNPQPRARTYMYGPLPQALYQSIASYTIIGVGRVGDGCIGGSAFVAGRPGGASIAGVGGAFFAGGGFIAGVGGAFFAAGASIAGVGGACFGGTGGGALCAVGATGGGCFAGAAGTTLDNIAAEGGDGLLVKAALLGPLHACASIVTFVPGRLLTSSTISSTPPSAI